MVKQNRVTQDLLKQFGFDAFRQGQKQVVDRILDGKASLAVFPTGAGKSLCYQLPALALPGVTLVISPLIALMKDQEDFLRSKGIPAARLDSTLTRDEANTIIGQAITGHLKILMISVERLRNELFRGQLKRMTISLLVVDEAHCISEWGHNFRPDYLKIPGYKTEFSIPQVLLLTATATPKVAEDICSKFGITNKGIVRTGFFRPNLHIRVVPAKDGNEKLAQLVSAMEKAPHGPAIIYATLQKTAEATASYLSQNGFPCEAYHAGLAPEVRADIQDRFMDGSLQTVAATIAFGMGIDKSDIRKVIHFDPPKSIEGYSQEIGRAGRDNAKSVCTLIGSREGIHTLENFIYGDTPPKESIHRLLTEIRSLQKPEWEVRQNELSRTLDMRPLPLKTLLVYLELFKIIKPLRVFFESYAFTYHCPKQEILDMFQGDRRTFVQTLMDLSIDKKVWSYPDMDAICRQSRSPRERVLSALAWFEEKGLITLKQSRAVDVFEILDNGFDVSTLTQKIFGLFADKEKSEIQRIHKILEITGQNQCLAGALSAYFGEPMDRPCQNCSVCQGEYRPIPENPGKQDLSTMNLMELAPGFIKALPNKDSRLIAKFLCGITSPSIYKFKREKGFARLEAQPFHDVLSFCQNELKTHA